MYSVVEIKCYGLMHTELFNIKIVTENHVKIITVNPVFTVFPVLKKYFI